MPGASGYHGVTHVDRGWNALHRALEQLKRGDAYAKIGILGEKAAKVEEEHQQEGQKEPMTNVRLALIHEFGTKTVPERSFIRSTFDAKRAGYMLQLRSLVKGVYELKIGARKALEIVGLRAKWDQKNAILQGAGIPPPLSPATVKAKERKGRWRKKPAEDPVRTLVDTARLVAAIDHAVVFGVNAPTKGEGE